MVEAPVRAGPLLEEPPALRYRPESYSGTVSAYMEADLEAVEAGGAAPFFETEPVGPVEVLLFPGGMLFPPPSGHARPTGHPGEGWKRSRPRTSLGRQLWEIRERIVASGAPLLDWDEIEEELADRRGGFDEEEA